MYRISLILVFVYLVVFLNSESVRWVENIGGENLSYVQSISCDYADNSYITGYFTNELNIQNNIIYTNGETGRFLAKLDSEGGLVWLEQYEVEQFGQPIKIITNFEGSSFILSFTELDTVLRKYSISKIANDGTFLWIYDLPAFNSFEMGSIDFSLDNSNNIYITGSFFDNLVLDEFLLTSNGEQSLFVAKLLSDRTWEWAKLISVGESNNNQEPKIVTDNNGNIYISDRFSDIVSFDSIELMSMVGHNFFVSKIDQDGNWIWAEEVSSEDNLLSSNLSIDNVGNLYISGFLRSTTNFGDFTSIYPDSDDNIFVAKINSEGSWEWIEFSSTENGINYGLSIDSLNNAYITGLFNNYITFGDYTLISNSNESNAYVAKIDENGIWSWAHSLIESDNALFIGEPHISVIDDNILLAGTYMGDITIGDFHLDSNSNLNSYLASLQNNTSLDNIDLTNGMKVRNFPNPFNPKTNIEFSIESKSEVEVSIFNLKGQKINTLVKSNFDKGKHIIQWYGKDKYGDIVSSGIYYYSVKIDNNYEKVNKCILLK